MQRSENVNGSLKNVESIARFHQSIHKNRWKNWKWFSEGFFRDSFILDLWIGKLEDFFGQDFRDFYQRFWAFFRSGFSGWWLAAVFHDPVDVSRDLTWQGFFKSSLALCLFGPEISWHFSWIHSSFWVSGFVFWKAEILFSYSSKGFANRDFFFFKRTSFSCVTIFCWGISKCFKELCWHFSLRFCRPFGFRIVSNKDFFFKRFPHVLSCFSLLLYLPGRCQDFWGFKN